jgi:hypothetical protein
MNIVQLDLAIREVAPIHGVSIGRYEDKATWRIDFKDEATDKQKADALKVVKHAPAALTPV